MFVYQNANRDICVTFKSRMPVQDPEYVIAIDHEKGIIKVNGNEMVPAVPAEDEAVEPETPTVEEPTEQEEDEPVADPDVTEGDDEDESEE